MTLDLTMVNPVYGTGQAGFGNALTGGYGYGPVAILQAPPFTIDVWVKPANATGTQVIIGKQNSFWIGLNAGVAEFHYGRSSTEVNVSSGTNLFNDGLWHHIRCVLTPSGGSISIDGVFKASSATTPTAAVMYTEEDFGESTLRWGINYVCFRAYSATGSTPFAGAMQNPAYYNIALPTNYTKPTAPPSNSDTGQVAHWPLDSSGVNTGTNRTVIAPNDVSIEYSPGAWKVTSAQAKTVNNHSYLRFIFGGTSLNLLFSLTGITAPYAQIVAKVDGFEQAPQVISTNTPITINAQTNLQTTLHYCEIHVKSTSQTSDRWNAQTTAVQLTGLSLELGRSLVAPIPLNGTMFIFGDSITEGVRTVAVPTASATDDTISVNAFSTWAHTLAKAFGLKYGIIGFGGQGVYRAPASPTFVPGLKDSWNLLWAGEPRVYPLDTELIICNMGQNDVLSGGGKQQYIDGYITVLNGWLSTCPNAYIFCIDPFNNNRGDGGVGPNFAVQAAISGCSDPSRVTYIPTNTGTLAPYVSTKAKYELDGLHPNANQVLANVGPKLYNVIAPLYYAKRYGTSSPPVVKKVLTFKDGLS